MDFKRRDPSRSGDLASAFSLEPTCRAEAEPWSRYESHGIINSGSQDTKAELALGDCQKGHFDTSIAEFEQLLRTDRITLPTGSRWGFARAKCSGDGASRFRLHEGGGDVLGLTNEQLVL
jgi:hypothetical protein